MKYGRGTTPIRVGSSIGPYRVSSVIGSGGMGVVYEAHRDDEWVAVKVMHPQRFHDPRARRRFRDETLAGSIVHHANVAHTLGHGEIEGIPYLVMERVCGEPLGIQIQRDGAPSLRRAVLLTRQILAGLAALHSAGIVHGDVKSDNVLVEHADDGTIRAMLIDLGLAHVQFGDLRDARRPDLDEAMVSGTPEYMAPEVIRGEGSSMASDLYAVGIILYELITGRTPFAGGTPGEIAQRHLHDEVVPPSLRCEDDVPAILDRIVLHALAKDPAQRFSSADAFAAALATTLPVVSDVPSQRNTMRLSRESPTLEWGREVARSVARGSGGRAGSKH